MSTKYKHGDRVPTETLAARLDELSLIVAKQGAEPLRFRDAFTMRVPAELDRDADLVLHEAAARLRELEGIVDAVTDGTHVEYPKRILATFTTRPAELPSGELHGED